MRSVRAAHFNGKERGLQAGARGPPESGVLFRVRSPPLPMTLPPPRRRLPALAASLIAFCYSGYGSAQAPPDGAPARWTLSDLEGDAWIPTEVSLAAEGEWVLGAAHGSHAGLVLLASGALGGPQLLRSLPLPETHTLRLATRGAELFAAAVFPVADEDHREALVWGMAPDELPLAPAWLHAMGETEGDDLLLRVGAQAGEVVAALSRHPQQVIQVDWLRASDGQLVERTLVPGPVLRELAVSDDALRVAILTGSVLTVLDRSADTPVLLSEPWVGAPGGLALSGDGTVLAAGVEGRVELRRWTELGFESGEEIPGRFGEVATVCRLSADGELLIIGWWNAFTGRGARFEGLDLTTGERLFEHEQINATNLQNFPIDVSVDADGTRAALAFWGGAGEPEVVLLDVTSGETLLACDVPGSPSSVALAADGTRLSVAHKSAHANEFGSSGAIALFDTEERDLEVIGAPTDAGLLRLLHRGGSLATWFVFGVEGSPTVLAFRTTRESAAGAWLEVPLVVDPALIGLEIASIAVTPSAAGPVWSATTAWPAVL